MPKTRPGTCVFFVVSLNEVSSLPVTCLHNPIGEKMSFRPIPSWNHRCLDSPLIADLWVVIGDMVGDHVPTYLALSRVSVATFVALGSLVQVMEKYLKHDQNRKHKYLPPIVPAHQLFHSIRWEQLTGRHGATFEIDVIENHFHQLHIARFFQSLRDRETLSECTAISGSIVCDHMLEAFHKAHVSNVCTRSSRVSETILAMTIKYSVNPGPMLDEICDFLNRLTVVGANKLTSTDLKQRPFFIINSCLPGDASFIYVTLVPDCYENRGPCWWCMYTLFEYPEEQMVLSERWWMKENNSSGLWMSPFAAYSLLTGKIS
jgi:hypothetical protein